MRNVKLSVVTAPSVEPVTLEEAKAFLRLETDADDVLITEWITAARLKCESILSRTFITTTWLAKYDNFPPYDPRSGMLQPYQGSRTGVVDTLDHWTIQLPRPALQSVAWIKYYDMGGTLQTLSPSLYMVNDGTPGQIQPAWGTIFPITQPRHGAVQVQYVAGYGDTAADVPAVVKMGIKAILGFWYENRDLGMIVPETIENGLYNILQSESWGHYG